MTFVGSAADKIPVSTTWNAWVSLGTAFTCLLFVVAYAVLARWWRTYEGKVLMGMNVAIGLLAAYTFIVVKVTPESTFMRWARVVVIATVGVFMLFQTRQLVTNQTARKRQDKDRRDYHV